MFEIRDLRYKDIIHIPSMNIPSKSIISIVGPSGSGKSTFLRLLTHLITPTKGKVLYHNEDLKEMDPISIRKKILMVPQSPVMFDGTIKDNLLIGLKFTEQEFPEDNRLKEILSMFRLNKELAEDVDHLSGGEKQRLALARSLLMYPEVLLLDEPTSALDDDTAESIMSSVMEYVKQKEMSVLMVTHDEEIAEKYAEDTIDMGPYRLTEKRDEDE
ncbi:ABC transporter ATP-binding protein [Mangrovibacillus cuniculi]|uniref:ATP-binding cassette domain-containing protein n=1 Tax=Mangrovibacillus cuniculi TaxID=2593652 RepID=A0A7S8CD65_9BACI|nr:ATP-binding cassette domain-containing protein [Mangrovibacillus cuniculi]QPC47836.1 ATP-binding cassette domain-containing protein [Mangrovibacillus cuniculi]